jgi:hypothetical protein
MQMPLRIVTCLSLVATTTLAFKLAEEPHGNPVSRVTALLKDMKTQLENEADTDEATYEKFAQWCTCTDQEKTKAIADAESLILQLEQTIETNTAKSASLKVEIVAVTKEVAANQKSLDTAVALRERQAAEFTEEEKEMLESIRALDAAVVILSKHHSAAALLDTKGHAAASEAVTADLSAASQAAVTAEALLRQHFSLLRGVVTPHQRQVVQSLVAQKAKVKDDGDHFDKKPPGQSYSSQSGEIFGILNQMKETFESNLSQSQKDELVNQETFKALKAAKEEEIKTGQQTLEDKKFQLVAAEQALVQAKGEKADTETTLAADKDFLMELKLTCQNTDHDWEVRQKARQEELDAVNEALTILTSDASRELFGKTFNAAPAPAAASLLQTLRTARSVRRERAAAVLLTAAKEAGNPKLAMLANKVQLDAFTRVKKAIDDMVAELQKEAEDEQKHKDFCVDELAKNERDTASGVHTKAKTEARVAKIEANVHNLEEVIKTLEDEIVDLGKQRDQAKVDRDAQNGEFELLVADQRKTQELLGQALAALKAAYSGGGSLVQVGSQVRLSGAADPQPKGFGKMEKQRGSRPILALLEHIMADAHSMELQAIADEDSARESYQDFVQETVRGREAKQASIVDRTSEKAQADQDLAQAKSELEGTVAELESFATSLTELKSQCDFFLGNFDARTKARAEEVEALRSAKAFLSGMDKGDAGF